MKSNIHARWDALEAVNDWNLVCKQCFQILSGAYKVGQFVLLWFVRKPRFSLIW